MCMCCMPMHVGLKTKSKESSASCKVVKILDHVYSDEDILTPGVLRGTDYNF